MSSSVVELGEADSDPCTCSSHDSDNSLPLIFTALNFYPTYGDDIKQQVEEVKLRIERFVAVVTAFEPSLGDHARIGRHRHISRKLKWRFDDSKAVERLQREIGGHMRILDDLLQRLTLYVMRLDLPWSQT